MDRLEYLHKLLQNRITLLTREAGKLTRMAGAATDHRERRWLRDKARSTRNKVKLLQSRYDKIIKLAEANSITRQEGMTQHG